MNNKKGFTLVEIMIVVVIIGLLAAMAIPAFQQVRTSSRESAMENDARQLSSAAQQYFLENNVTDVTAGVTSGTGAVTGALSDYVRTVSQGMTFAGVGIGMQQGGTFSLSVDDADVGNAGVMIFDEEGKLVP